MVHRDVLPWLKFGVYVLGLVGMSLNYSLAAEDWRIGAVGAALAVLYAVILWRWNKRLIQEEKRQTAEIMRHLKEEGKPDVDLYDSK